MNSYNCNINRLRVFSSAPRVILTERGVGYVFALPVESL